jgi:hypothetical protein
MRRTSVVDDDDAGHSWSLIPPILGGSGNPLGSGRAPAERDRHDPRRGRGDREIETGIEDGKEEPREERIGKNGRGRLRRRRRGEGGRTVEAQADV